MARHAFFDPFFFAVVVFVTALTFADFLLGKKGRERSRELVGKWWVYLEDSTFAGLGAADAARIEGWFRRRLGPITSWRFWVLTFAGVSLLYVASLFVLFAVLDEAPDAQDPAVPLAVFDWLVERGAVVFSGIVILPVVSLAVTMGFLRLMASMRSLLLLAALALGDIVAVLVLMVLTVVFVQRFRTWDPVDFGNVIDQIMLLCGGLVSLVPIVLHIVLTALFMASKLTAPVVRKPVNLILLRIHESDQGALTLIGIAVGAVAKLVQEGLKLV